MKPLTLTVGGGMALLEGDDAGLLASDAGDDKDRDQLATLLAAT